MIVTSSHSFMSKATLLIQLRQRKFVFENRRASFLSPGDVAGTVNILALPSEVVSKVMA